MRGKLKPAWDALGAGRNIPAYAGKTVRELDTETEN